MDGMDGMDGMEWHGWQGMAGDGRGWQGMAWDAPAGCGWRAPTARPTPAEGNALGIRSKSELSSEGAT